MADLIEGDPAAAVEQLRSRLRDDPLNASAYRMLANALRAENPAVQTIRSSVGDNQLARAAQALHARDLETAEIILRRRLLDTPDDPEALRMMAALARMLKYDAEEEQLLRLALELKPDFNAATFELATSLDRQKRHNEAVEMLDRLLEKNPGDARVLYFRGTQLTRSGRFEDAVDQFADLVKIEPDRPEFWTSYGHVLKTLGRRDQALAAIRRAIELAPAMGIAWWSLSEFKTLKFSQADISAMEAALDSTQLPDTDRLHLHFALGKAFEDNGNPEAAFFHYAEGNRLRRAQLPAERGELSAYVSAAETSFTKKFFHARRASGAAARDPIFILGMTRAGSTLIEQILSSHPLVEGTMELPDMPQLGREISTSLAEYAKLLEQQTPEELTAVGERYLERTRGYRKTGRPFFTDKMPNNWMHVPLIHLALPNARIIDARRHPLACCFSNFKQHFAMGQAFSYDLGELGRFYSDYVRMMAHIDRVLPGRVHRVFHERLVEDSEEEIRRMLDYLELPFDESCLRFYETKRPVRSASADQVRRPIDRKSVDTWRAFEPWLGPLQEALGPVLDAYPEAPDFSRK